MNRGDVTFGSLHARLYDAIYDVKDYDLECDLLEGLFSDRARGPVRSILDLGCGTGGHAYRLASRGYQVVGVDRSPEMLEVARSKLTNTDPYPEFVLGDMREAEGILKGRTFDAVVMMFTAVGYLHSLDDIRRTFRGMACLVKPGGIFIADYWYAPAVVRSGPSNRFRQIAGDNEVILRSVEGEIDYLHQLYNMKVTLWRVRDRAPVEQAVEEHWMRFFSATELEALLTECGFESIEHLSFPSGLSAPEPDDWWAAVVARRR